MGAGKHGGSTPLGSVKHFRTSLGGGIIYFSCLPELLAGHGFVWGGGSNNFMPSFGSQNILPRLTELLTTIYCIINERPLIMSIIIVLKSLPGPPVQVYRSESGCCRHTVFKLIQLSYVCCAF